MRRTCLLFLGGLFLLLSACAPNPSDGTEDSRTQIVATTYPVYLFACEVTRGVPDCTVTLMIDQPKKSKGYSPEYTPVSAADTSRNRSSVFLLSISRRSADSRVLSIHNIFRPLPG